MRRREGKGRDASQIVGEVGRGGEDCGRRLELEEKEMFLSGGRGRKVLFGAEADRRRVLKEEP